MLSIGNAVLDVSGSAPSSTPEWDASSESF